MYHYYNKNTTSLTYRSHSVGHFLGRPNGRFYIGLVVIENSFRDCGAFHSSAEQLAFALGSLRLGFQVCQYRVAWYRGNWFKFYSSPYYRNHWQFDFLGVFSVACRIQP